MYNINENIEELRLSIEEEENDIQMELNNANEKVRTRRTKLNKHKQLLRTLIATAGRLEDVEQEIVVNEDVQI